MVPTKKQIEEIADNMDSGMKCYYNFKTGDLKTIINFGSSTSADKGPWERDLKGIEENWGDYIEFEGMSSDDLFELMADFVDSIDNKSLQHRLINALNEPKPFRSFKWQINNSGDYRQQWFLFKRKRYIQRVKDQIYINLEDFNK